MADKMSGGDRIRKRIADTAATMIFGPKPEQQTAVTRRADAYDMEMELIQAKRDAAERMDSVLNTLTAMGTTSDKGAATEPNTSRAAWSPRQLDSFYRYNGYAQRIIDVVPADATRKGWKVGDEENKDVMADLDKSLSIPSRIATAHMWARLYGGALVVMVTDDDIPAEFQDRLDLWLAQPLDLDRVNSLQALQIVSIPDEAQAEEWDGDFESTNFNKPLTWRISPIANQTTSKTPVSTLVHHTRCLYFPGKMVPPNIRVALSGGDDSIIQGIWDQISTKTTVDQAAAIAAQEMKVDVLKIAGFGGKKVGDEAELHTVKMRLIARSKSLLNMVLIGDGDDYQTRSGGFTGFKDLDEETKVALAAVTGIPLTKLFGTAPQGLSTDDKSGRTFWAELISAVQTIIYQSPLERLYEVAYSAKDSPTKGQIPDKWRLEFNPLDELTEQEDADLKKTTAETDSINITSGVYGPEHVRVSRYAEEGFQTELQPVEEFELIPFDETMEAEESEAEEQEQEQEQGATRAEEIETDIPEQPAQNTALNGAQITAAVDIVKSVSLGELSRESAEVMLMSFFNLSQPAAKRMLAGAKKAKVPETMTQP